MTTKTFEELLEGYEKNSLTNEELESFLQFIKEKKYEDAFKDSIDKLLNSDVYANISDQSRADIIFSRIMSAATEHDDTRDAKVIELNKRPKLFSILKFAAAASVIAAALLGGYLWYVKGPKNEIAKTEVKSKQYKNDVLPGKDKAVLTLADGSVIVLDDAQNGALAEQGNTKIIKLGGKLAYDLANSGTKEVLYNTISTPRGGQYQVELPDGSLVWLNAASSLRFPTAFVGKERRVEITGEAYFEVAKNKDLPFIVSVNGSEVRVLGTHFNVMAYSEEAAVKTTLLEGSVKFVHGNSSSLLQPGQQSQLLKGGRVKVVNDIDVNDVMAWKNGMFNFENADLESIMRQLSRWYDVEVQFENEPAKDLFILEMSRSSKLSDILKVLELTGNIHFEIQGKKIIVMP